MKQLLVLAVVLGGLCQAGFADEIRGGGKVVTAFPVTPSVESRAVELPPVVLSPTSDKRVGLPTLENEALKQARSWQTTGRAKPLLGDDGVVQYPYGEYMPTLVCAAFRACIIDLEVGELISPHGIKPGDKLRWVIDVSQSGEGATTRWHVIIKPRYLDIETNLVIMTNRRVYDIGIKATNSDNFIHRMAFYYPQELIEADDSAVKAIAAKSVNVVDTISDPSKLNFNYKVSTNKYAAQTPMTPVRVFDNGVHTWIQLDPKVKNYEAPALVIKAVSGEWEIVNYRTVGDYYKVDRLFQDAQLVIGQGRKAGKVDIHRESSP